MRFGLFTPAANPFATPELLRRLGREADERGIDSLWFPEHVVLFDEYESSYPYAADGRIPTPPDSGILDPLDVISFMAGCTDRVRLGTGICLLPQRAPVYTAKEVATADWLSGGRVDFGIGVGWLREEFEVLGIPFEQRGRRADESIRLLKTLWTEEVPSFEGDFFSVRACRQDPKPVQDPHPPILVGGESDAALRRAANLGDGWFGFNLTPERLAELLPRLDEQLGAAGRRRDDLRVTTSPYLTPLTAEMIDGYAEQGLDEVIGLFFAASADDVPATLDAMMPLVERAHEA